MIITFSSSIELLESVSQFTIDTNFSIDSELDNEKGEDLAQKLYELGYLNLVMCSGYSEEKFTHLSYIKKTIGKAPPFSD